MKDKGKSYIMPMFVFLVLLLKISVVYGSVPERINYQGYLTNNSGQPITTTVSMTFRIYTVASGGSALWTETQSITPNEGVFSVILGSTNALFLDYSVNSQYYLGVQVGSDAEMTPRQLINSVGSSHTADTSLDLVCTNCVSGEEVNLSEIQKRVTGTCAAGNSIREINSDGTVTCEPDDGSAAETDPQVGAVTFWKWCVGDGSAVQCSVNPPVLSETDPKVGVLTSGKWCTTNGTSVICTADLPGETDPQVGSLTNGKWCTTNGTQVICTADAPTTLTGWTDDGTTVRLSTTTDNVGIGVSPAQSKLHVAGDIRLNSGGPYSTISTGNDTRLNLYSNTSATDSRSWIELWGNDTTRAGELALAGTYIDMRYGSTNSSIGNVGARLTTSGNLGIGINTPSEKVQVEGNLLVTNTSSGKSLRLRTTGAALDMDMAGANLYVNGDSGNIMLVHNARSNVGIGTTDPKAGYKLDVGGNVHVSGTIKKEYAGTTYRVIPAAYGDISPTTEHKATNNFIVTRNCDAKQYEIGIDGETNFCDRYAVSITFKDYGAIRIARTSTLGCEYITIRVFDIWGNPQDICGSSADNHAFTFVVFIQ